MRPHICLALQKRPTAAHQALFQCSLLWFAWNPWFDYLVHHRGTKDTEDFLLLYGSDKIADKTIFLIFFVLFIEQSVCQKGKRANMATPYKKMHAISIRYKLII